MADFETTGIACHAIALTMANMSYRKWWQNFTVIRIIAYVLPPIGVLLLWLSPLLTVKRKVGGTIFVAVYMFAIGYGVAVVGAFLWAWDVRYLEWRGSFFPSITWSKTSPDYKRLEENRAAQANIKKGINAGVTSASTNLPYWTGFRGANRDGHFDQHSITTNWPSAGLRELWRQPVGGGYASFAVAEGRLYTIEQRRENEVAAAYDAQTGFELWTQQWEGQFEEGVGGNGPRATPTYNNGRVYVQGALGEFRCLEAATGKVLWQHNIITENGGTVLAYGIAASPLIVDDKVIVLTGGEERSIVAYDKISGKTVWRSLSDKHAYVSPMVVELAGVRQLLVMTAHRAVGLEPATGKLLWDFVWRVQNDNVISQPVIIGSNRFLLSAGYGTGCAAVEITKEQTQTFNAKEIWRNKLLKNKFSSSVYSQGYIYGVDEDILTCLDAATGERKWKDGRFGYGQVLLAQDHLIILSGNGELALVRATPMAFVEMARFQVLKGKTWNPPAIADGKIFVRNAAEMACFDIKAR